MSERMKCKCGGKARVVRHSSDGPAAYSGVCESCGRSGPYCSEQDAAWAAWDADHEAAAKAREALRSAKVIPFYAYGDNQAAVRMIDTIDEALALLGEEDHGNQ